MNRKATTVSAGLLLCLLLGALLQSAAAAAPDLNLPPYPVTATHVFASDSYYHITLSGVGSGYDVSDGVYNGWGTFDDSSLTNPPSVMLYSSFDPNLPLNIRTYQDSCIPLVQDGEVSIGDPVPWDKLNYLLNHRPENATMEQIQAAIWRLMWGDSWLFDGVVQSMLADAHANGSGFTPGPGQIIVVILYADGFGCSGWCDDIIEITLPENGEVEGCTPGYWKQEQHFDSWATSPYSPYETYFDDVFGVGPHSTLLSALGSRGGGEKALLRHATAALLNASSTEVTYFYNAADIITMVQNAYASGDFESAKDGFEFQNESLCPLD